MRWGGGRESENVEDRRSGGGMGRGIAGGGIGVIVIAVAAMFLGVDPSLVMSVLEGTQPGMSAQAPAQKPPANDTQAKFVSVVLADTEDTWRALFQKGGAPYREPKLVLFRGAVQSACGHAQAAMGPFYCPGDEKVYIDLAFFDDLQKRFKAPGDFAQAYVIAHEIGHHVQNLLGITGQVASEGSGARQGANSLSVRLELQADCFAGVWAHDADRRSRILEAGDLEEGIAAAGAVGDDRLQRRTEGRIVPDSFTHGSSAQRIAWFRRGFEYGDPNRCDTFRAETL